MKIDDEMYNKIFSDDDVVDKKINDNVDVIETDIPDDDIDETIDESTDTVEKITVNKNKISSNIYDWVHSILIAVVAVVVILTFCFRLIDVDGTSMESTLINTDKVIITDLFYTPENGDIVVISHAEDYDKPLVKRVIATEGQSLRIDFDTNQVYVNGELLDEPYIQGTTVRGDAEIPEVIPEGKVFVLGDNRTFSKDSRYSDIGLIDVNNIIGKAQFVIVPHSYENGSTVPEFDISGIRYLY
ncbi:MAG: signal peptidase I [Eubacteriales bacterium]|nr:signal peptidase I [Eubacteriales bacterium]